MSRQEDGTVFLGNKEAAKECKRLHKLLDDALGSLSGIQQGIANYDLEGAWAAYKSIHANLRKIAKAFGIDVQLFTSENWAKWETEVFKDLRKQRLKKGKQPNGRNTSKRKKQ